MNIRSLKDVNDMISKLNRVWTIKDAQGSIQGTDSCVVFDFSPKANAMWFPPLRKMTEEDGTLWWNVPAAREIVKRINALSLITFRSYRGAAFVADANVIFEAGQTGSNTPSPLPLPNRQTLRSASKAEKVFQYANRILQPGNGVQITETKDNVVFSFDKNNIIPDGMTSWEVYIQLNHSIDSSYLFVCSFLGISVSCPPDILAKFMKISYITTPERENITKITIYVGSAFLEGKWSIATDISLAGLLIDGNAEDVFVKIEDSRGFYFSENITIDGPPPPAVFSVVMLNRDFSLTVS